MFTTPYHQSIIQTTVGGASFVKERTESLVKSLRTKNLEMACARTIQIFNRLNAHLHALFSE